MPEDTPQPSPDLDSAINAVLPLLPLVAVALIRATQALVE
jgi:hypothetical protein